MAADPADELARLRKGVADGIERNQLRLLRLSSGIALVVAGAALAAVAFVAIAPSTPWSGGTFQGQPTQASFAPPALSDIPSGPEG